MDEFGPTLIMVCVVLALAIVGVVNLSLDMRYFGTLVHECKTQGYIQDKTTRLYCGLEKIER